MRRIMVVKVDDLMQTQHCMRSTMVVKVDDLTQNQRSMRGTMVVENRPTAPPPPIEKLMLMSWGAASFKIKDSLHYQ